MSPSRPPQIEVRTSVRRKRTATATFEGDRIVVLVPATLPVSEHHKVAERLARRLIERGATRRAATDTELTERARVLSEKYFAGAAQPASIRWVDNQQTRWGSCTPATKAVRISSKLRAVPDWVLDSVIVHELAHLLVGDHSRRFKDLVARYPRTEEARVWLAGYAWGLQRQAPSGPPARRPTRRSTGSQPRRCAPSQDGSHRDCDLHHPAERDDALGAVGIPEPDHDLGDSVGLLVWEPAPGEVEVLQLGFPTRPTGDGVRTPQ